MVQTDASQLAAECTDWRQILRNYRNEFHDCEKALLQMCKQRLNKEDLLRIEHFQNQFDIQLDNIHDLKHTIKQHERAVAGDAGGEELYVRHEQLLAEFLSLENILQELRNEFRDFVDRGGC